MKFKESTNTFETKSIEKIDPNEASLFTASVSFFNFRSSLVEIVRASNLSEDRQTYMLHNIGGVLTLLGKGFSLLSAEKDFKEALKINTNESEELEILNFFITGLKDLYTKFRAMNPHSSE